MAPSSEILLDRGSIDNGSKEIEWEIGGSEERKHGFGTQRLEISEPHRASIFLCNLLTAVKRTGDGKEDINVAQRLNEACESIPFSLKEDWKIVLIFQSDEALLVNNKDGVRIIFRDQQSLNDTAAVLAGMTMRSNGDYWGMVREAVPGFSQEVKCELFIAARRLAGENLSVLL